jgi:hypothetical protein
LKAELFFCHECKKSILVIHAPELRKEIYVVYKCRQKDVPCLEKIIVVDEIKLCPKCMSPRIQSHANRKMKDRMIKQVQKRNRGGA